MFGKIRVTGIGMPNLLAYLNVSGLDEAIFMDLTGGNKFLVCESRLISVFRKCQKTFQDLLVLSHHN